MSIGKKLAATAAVVGMTALGGAAVAGTASADAGVHLTAGHNAGIYNSYSEVDNAHKLPGVSDLQFSSDPNRTDGIDATCYINVGKAVNGWDNRWYHASYAYYNHSAQKLTVNGWVYAAYVDNSAAINGGQVPHC